MCVRRSFYKCVSNCLGCSLAYLTRTRIVLKVSRVQIAIGALGFLPLFLLSVSIATQSFSYSYKSATGVDRQK